MSSQSNPLVPTWQGHIASTLDALILFEASLSGIINHVPRRPHDRERQDLIRSGCVFIYEEHSSGIKRWTDGVSWSPSRILGNFLIYRELEKPFPPGEKKRALKKKKCPSGGVQKPDNASRPSISNFSAASVEPGKDHERALIGSLIDSYPFKTDGLVKKTITITYNKQPHHLVSYYNVDDVMNGRLITPSKDPRFRDTVPRMDLMTSQHFRAPVDEVEYGPDGNPALFAALPNGGHDFASGSGSILQRAWTGPTMQTVPVASYSNPPPFSFQSQAPPPSYVTSMGSSMSVPLTSPMPPPPSAPMASHSPSSMPSHTAPPLSYAPQSQGNYALDPNRTARYGSSNNIAHEFPRHMPTHSPPRRPSLFETTPSDLSDISMGSVTEQRPVASNNGQPYLHHQASYYMPHRPHPMNGQDAQGFPSPRQMKLAANHVAGGSQQYGLDENNAPWTFDGIDGNPEQQY
ncbi:hypothetical protein HIM_07152 [Hirsutella minnesotensis 3608]|uniref:Global transcription regulator sge1 n=1 Tax=Hirsutella minnesotensis 3608 TaxID=1043627 RepID=A0A0F7ZTM2_9HYPO|nr:hypothetical protein HIM_07152 [Hirsutella minnesotensis 3608]